jgi:hypothetical protein
VEKVEKVEKVERGEMGKEVKEGADVVLFIGIGIIKQKFKG